MKARKTLYLLGAAALLVALAPTTASAQVPGVLPIQGYITDAEGTPYDAEVAIRFALYDAPAGGAELFSERISAPVTGGVFTAYLGSTTALDMGLFREHTAVYLGITIGADAEATPRLPFGTVPFAAVSDSTGSFGGVDADDFPTTVEEWALAACPDTVEELSAVLDPVYANPAWDAITGVPADIADGDDGFTTEAELTALLDDNYGNPAWDTITGMPAGFADGMDNGFTTEDELTALLNDNYRAAGWAPGWGDIVGIPAGFADGVDNVVTAGAGLSLDGSTMSVDFDGPGEADTAARSDAVETMAAEIEDLQDQLTAVTAALEGNQRLIRYAVWDDYDGWGGWAMGNRTEMFGGVNPSNWGNGGYRAWNMSNQAGQMRTLFNRKLWPGPNAMVYNEQITTPHAWSSSNTSRWAAVLMRIRNNTGSSISIPGSGLCFYFSAYGGWSNYASLSLNGASTWSYTSNTTQGTACVGLNIPARRTSTVVVMSSSYYYTNSYNWGAHNLTLGFYNNSLTLPVGLQFVDDLDQMADGTNIWAE